MTDQTIKKAVEDSGVLAKLEKCDAEFIEIFKSGTSKSNVYDDFLTTLYFYCFNSDNTAHSFVTCLKEIKHLLEDISSKIDKTNPDAQLISDAKVATKKFLLEIKECFSIERKRVEKFLEWIHSNFLEDCKSCMDSCEAFLTAIVSLYHNPSQTTLKSALHCGTQYLRFVAVIDRYISKNETYLDKFVSQGLRKALGKADTSEYSRYFQNFEKEKERLWEDRIKKLTNEHKNEGISLPDTDAIKLYTSTAYQHRNMITELYDAIFKFTAVIKKY